MNDLTTNQVKNSNKINNPTGKGGFGDHPENRNDGRWDKNNSFTYWMNFFKKLSVKEFKDYYKQVPEDKMSVAQHLAFVRIKESQNNLDSFKEVANRTEGLPTRKLEHSGGIEVTELSKKEEEELDEFVRGIKKSRPKEKDSG